MNAQPVAPGSIIELDESVPLKRGDWIAESRRLVRDGARPVALLGTKDGYGVRVWLALASDSTGELFLNSTVFSAHDRLAYAALSYDVPQMNYFECDLYEQTGIVPERHPWLRPVRSGNGWRRDGNAYSFYRVEGEEVHEVGVGPVHAGVIEPGHFRFQCHGEEILHVEIHLGYQHRGVEELLPRQNRAQQLVLVESIAGDSVIAHSTAFCAAIETLSGFKPSLRSQAVRGIAAELERIAMHLSTLSGIATDIGFALPAAAFGALRTSVINLTAEICGSRFGRGWIIPGGVRFDFDEALIARTRSVLLDVLAKFPDVEALLFDAPSALARMEGTGIVTLEQACAIPLVGLAARASGVSIDARSDFPYGIYRYSSVQSPTLESGDVYARAKLRALEIRASIEFIREQLDNLPPTKSNAPVAEMKPNGFVVSLVEGHRGEIAHMVFTDARGTISQVKIKDPSFNNWQGVAVGVRENGISDFPLCNKSFDLSYAGHDL